MDDQTIRRAADAHAVMAAIHPKPKPTKAGRVKKKKAMRGTCPRCGAYGPKPLVHNADCPQDFPVIYHREAKTPRQRIEEALETMCKAIIHWRDADRVCVIADMDGGRCGGGPQWGHVLGRTTSAWLKYDLSNSFRQCETHNRIHPSDPIYFDWWRAKFGSRAWRKLNDTMRQRQNQDRPLSEYEDILLELNDLYDARHAHGTDTLPELVAAGYYGPIIKSAWIEEGRI